jgi:vacuole morphology and inheritance protein 14
MFLVSWITLLDSVPDLELVAYLPSFLGGLFKFLGDPNPDVHTATQAILEKFLKEITKISRLKKKRADRENEDVKSKDSVSSKTPGSVDDEEADGTDSDSGSEETDDDLSNPEEDDWVPGQDIQIDYAKILDILVTFLGGAAEQEIQLTALKWIDGLFNINPNEIIAILPRLLTQLLPALASEVVHVRQAAEKVNRQLLNSAALAPSPSYPGMDRRESTLSPTKIPRANDSVLSTAQEASDQKDFASSRSFDLDWEATITALMDHFLNEHEETRAAALEWLTALHRKAPPGRKLEIDDSTFPALLKTLSDPSEQVVLRCLALLSQISKSSDDTKFGSFMVSLLSLFSTDRKLLETRGNLIMRQLSINLNPERIYRTVADCLEKDDDPEFASIMIQNMNNNLITAPELSDLRRRLRNLDSRDGQSFFVVLFRSWCHNAVATLSLCLLAQAYEQGYHLLTIFADIEMTLNMLIQIDKLVQLLESPVFTCLFSFLFLCIPTNFHRSSVTTPGARPSSVPIQVPLWFAHASSSVLCLCYSKESS